MSIPINTDCVECHLKKRLALAKSLGSEDAAMDYARELLQFIATAPKEMDSTWLAYISEGMLKKRFAMDDDRFSQEKEFSNRFVLQQLPEIYARVEKAPDPVFAALQFSILGNYLDFSALQGEVSFEKFAALLDDAEQLALDKQMYEAFCQDLQKGKKLLYLTDNAGEIVFDRVLGEKIKEAYPHLEITYCVRGSAVANDALREDAEVAGLPFPVIDNGVAIGGTVLPFCSEELKQAMEQSDVIIAKGMGNTESLWGSDYNIYFAFLVKCVRFEVFFNKPKFTPMFLRCEN